MPNTQPFKHETLHLHSLAPFFLLMGNTPNLSTFDKSAWDMDIVTLCKWTIQLKTHFLWLLLGSSSKDTNFYLCKVVNYPKHHIFMGSLFNYFIQWSLKKILTFFGPFGWDQLHEYVIIGKTTMFPTRVMCGVCNM